MLKHGVYSCRCARCKLENVYIQNKGIDWSSDKNLYWRHDVQRFEALKVILHGNAEFEAVDVNLEVRFSQNCLYQIILLLCSSIQQRMDLH